MFDYHKSVGILKLPLLQVLKDDEFFEAYGRSFRRRKPGIYVSEANSLNTFRVTLKYPDIIIVENSIHKYIQGGLNVFDLSFKECLDGLIGLYKSFGVRDVDQVRLYKLELECSIQIDDAVTAFNRFHSHRSSHFVQLVYGGKVYGKYFQTDSHKLKIYSKYLQLKNDKEGFYKFSNLYPDQVLYLKNTLRIELQILKSRYSGLKGPITIKDIKNIEFIRGLYDKMLSIISHSVIETGIDSNYIYNKNQLLSYALLTHPNKELLNHMKINHYNQYRYNQQLHRQMISSPELIQSFVKIITDKVEKILENKCSDLQNTQHVNTM